MEDLKKFKQEILKSIVDNIDLRKKDIGDRVLIWDFSDCMVKETGKHFNNTSPESKEKYIIVEFGVYPVGYYGEWERNLWKNNPRPDNDVIISNGKIHVYTKERFIKLINS
jgi:hypothetical protein